MADEKLIKMYADIHATTEYGNSSVKNLRFLRPDIKLLKPKSVIDYGCGQSLLIDQLELPYPLEKRRYDPAIPAYSQKPSKVYDLLINVDVLEHIREDDLDPIIEEMRSLCRNAILIVDTVPARLVLPSGENAHATIRPKEWWREKLGRHFPHLIPIRVSRPWRAAFRTWDRPSEQDASFKWMRLLEDVNYVAGRPKQVVQRLLKK